MTGPVLAAALLAIAAAVVLRKRAARRRAEADRRELEEHASFMERMHAAGVVPLEAFRQSRLAVQRVSLAADISDGSGGRG